MEKMEETPSWINPLLKPQIKIFDGFPLCAAFDADNFRQTLSYTPPDGTLFIATYPKCGTTWVQMMVHLITHGGEPPKSIEQLMRSMPFLEFEGTEGVVDRQPRPHIFKTHLPFQLAPFNARAKYIYVLRNPWDTCISWFHFLRYVSGYRFWNGHLNTFASLFISGDEMPYGDYFQHVSSWCLAGKQYPDNILYLTYEDMKKDPQAAIVKIAMFMGDKYQAALINDETLIDKCVKYSSFDYMKELNKQNDLAPKPVSGDNTAKSNLLPPGLIRTRMNMAVAREEIRKEKLALGLDPDAQLGEFFRKGQVNDAQSQLTPAQCRQIGQRFDKLCREHGIESLWEDKSWLAEVTKRF